MGLIKISQKGSPLLCSEVDANYDWVLDLANATGELSCSKINQLSLSTCLLANSVIVQLQTDISSNATAIGEVSQDLNDAQTTLQNNINSLITLVGNQNTTIADLTAQIGSLTSAFNTLDSSVAAFNSRLLSVEGRLVSLEQAIASGIIVIWSGIITAIPSQYQLCNGTNGTPDLRDRFIVGAGSSYAVNTVGGSSTHTHSLNGTTGGTALTVNQMPAHSHGVSDPGHAHLIGGSSFFATGSTFEPRAPGRPGDAYVNPPFISSTLNSSNVSIQASGANEAHTHTFSSSTAATNNLPPYYALAYIMKL